MGDDEKTREIGKNHKAGARIDARSAHDDLPLAHGNLEYGAIERGKNPRLSQAVVNGLPPTERFIQAIFLNAKIGHHVQKSFLTEELALMELVGAIKVAFGFSHREARALDFSFGGGPLIEQIGIVNRHQEVTFFHTLSGDHMNTANFTADLWLHIDLQRGLHFTS